MSKVDLGNIVLSSISKDDITKAVQEAINSGWANVEFTTNDEGHLCILIPVPFYETD